MSRLLLVSRATAASVALSASLTLTNPTLPDILLPLGGQRVRLVEASLQITGADASAKVNLLWLSMVHLWADGAGNPINIGSTPSNTRLPVDTQWNALAAGYPLLNTHFFGCALTMPVESWPDAVVGGVQPAQFGLRGVAGVVNTDGAAAHTVTMTLAGLFERL